MKASSTKPMLFLPAILASVCLSGCGNDDREVNAPPTVGQAESSTGSTATEELLGSPEVQELQYPLAELEYPSYELTGVVSQ